MNAVPTLLVLRGLPGAGKTTVAQALAKERTLRVLSRDDVRSVLFSPCDWSEPEKEISFRAVLDAAAYELACGRDVVLEGMPFTRVQHIERARAVARTSGARVLVVELRVDLATAASRIEAFGPHEGREFGSASAEHVAARWEGYDADAVIDGTQPLDDVVAAVRALL